GVLAERVAGLAAGRQGVEAAVVARRHAPFGRNRPTSGAAHGLLGAGVGLPDRVEVEEVARLPGQDVDDLPAAGESVADGAWHRVALRPDDLVADQPAVFDKCQR